MFSPADRVHSFTQNLSFDDDIQQFKQNAGNLRAAGPQAIPNLENDVIFRCLMADYWANVATLPSGEFANYAPGSFNHNSVKESNAKVSQIAIVISQQIGSFSEFQQQLESYIEGSDELAMKIAPLIVSKLKLSQNSYIDFLVFEAGCWIFKNLAFQQMVGSRLQSPETSPWEFNDVIRVSQWVEAKVIPRFYEFKKTPGWDEVEIKVRLK